MNNRDINNNTNTRIISYSPEQNLNPVLNSSFENNATLSSTWNLVAASNTNNSLNQYSEIVEIANFNKFSVTGLNSNCSPNNRFVLLMYNANTTCYQTLQSSTITIQPRQYYKLTLWAWTDDANTAAHLTLVDKTADLTDEEKASDVSLEVTESADNNVYRGNWKQYSFYIAGHSTEAREVALNLILGIEAEPTKGYVFFDDIRLENIDSSKYSSASDGDATAKLAFTKENDSFLVDNSLFDLVEHKDDYSIMQPTGWTHSKSDNAANNVIYSGVINTTSTDFEANKNIYGNTHSYLVNPGATPMSNANNNILMIGSHAENIAQTYKSSDFTLSSSGCYRVSYYVYTSYYHTDTPNTGFRVAIVNNDNNTPLYNHYNIIHNNAWHLYEIYIKASTDDMSVNIQFNLENAQGYVFIDNVLCEKLEADDDDINIFDNHHSYNDNNTEIILDYSYENFETGIFNKTGSALNYVRNWTGKAANEVLPNDAGVLNTANANIQNGKHIMYLKYIDCYIG